MQSNAVATNLINALGYLKFIIIELRVCVAQTVSHSFGVKVKFILSAESLDAAPKQPLNTVIYFSTGIYRQLLKWIRDDPKLVEHLYMCSDLRLARPR